MNEIMLQGDVICKGYSTIHTIRGILRSAFRQAYDDDMIRRNPFDFELATVIVNDSVTREAITRDQECKYLEFVKQDKHFSRYYEGTKTDAGTRKIPITNDVADMFRAIIEDREPPKVEKVIDGHTGFLFYDENDMPLVAMHWQHRFNHMVGRYNDIYKVQMPNITPHVCRHTYCSNQAKSGMNPKTLQYLMGHSDISVTMNVYTHFGFDDAEEELKRMEEFRKAQAEVEKKNEKPMTKRMFKAI
ncbi:MAG: hypothetical protein EGS42_02655 [Coprococcus eutactus]|nr:hypothetical protein [Coprococcus eutactus]